MADPNIPDPILINTVARALFEAAMRSNLWKNLPEPDRAPQWDTLSEATVEHWKARAEKAVASLNPPPPATMLNAATSRIVSTDQERTSLVREAEVKLVLASLLNVSDYVAKAGGEKLSDLTFGVAALVASNVFRAMIKAILEESEHHQRP